MSAPVDIRSAEGKESFAPPAAVRMRYLELELAGGRQVASIDTGRGLGARGNHTMKRKLGGSAPV